MPERDAQPETAIEQLRRAVSADPNHHEAWVELARQLAAAGREDEAIACFESAVRLRPNAEQHAALGQHLLRRGRLDDGARHFEQAMRLSPTDVALRYRVAQALIDVNQPQAAQAVAEDALRLDPASQQARLQLAIAQLQQNHLEEALTCLGELLKQPNPPAVAIAKRGQALYRLGRFDEAETEARRAIALEPNSARHQADLAKVLLVRPSAEEALAAARRAIELDPADFVPHVYAAQALLRLGRFDEGWAEHEWRLRAGMVTPLGLPTWDGRALPPGESIVLMSEQGFGDGIQFLRYAPLVKERVGRVIVRCHAGLKDLFETASGVDEVITLDDPLPRAAAASIWTMSLPHRFCTSLATIPVATIPYLRHDPRRAEKFERAIISCFGGATTGKLRVGLVWKGNPMQADDRLRSARLDALLPALANVPGVVLVSLQKEITADEEAALARLEIIDLRTLNEDFADAAAAISTLDLVISVCTATAHLAGAMGRPVWTLLAQPAEWRWLEGRSDSPWYPTMRLFRQRRPGDWSGVAREVAAALADRVNSPAAT